MTTFTEKPNGFDIEDAVVVKNWRDELRLSVGHGNADFWIPEEFVRHMRPEMKQLGARLRISVECTEPIEPTQNGTCG